jgi:hypothetical protein
MPRSPLPSWSFAMTPVPSATRSTEPNASVRIMLSSWEPPIGIEPMTYALRGTRDLAAYAPAAPIARAIAQMALAALGLSGNPVHKPVHEQEAVARPSDRLNAPGPRGAGAFKRLRIRGQAGYSSALGWPRVAQVNPFAGGADGVAAARGGELDQAGALLTEGRCARWRPGHMQRPPSAAPDGTGSPRPRLAASRTHVIVHIR